MVPSYSTSSALWCLAIALPQPYGAQLWYLLVLCGKAVIRDALWLCWYALVDVMSQLSSTAMKSHIIRKYTHANGAGVPWVIMQERTSNPFPLLFLLEILWQCDKLRADILTVYSIKNIAGAGGLVGDLIPGLFILTDVVE